MSWREVHIAFHDGASTDELLLDAVRPFVAGLDDAGLPAHVARHWRQGPHVRVAVRCSDDDLDGVLLPLVDTHVRPWLAGAPSSVRLDPVAALPEHRRLAETERDDGPLLPWYPDNTVRVVAAADRAPVLGTATADLVAAGAVATTSALFAALEHRRRQGAPGIALAFDLLVLTAHRFGEHGIAGAALSFRSHAEAHLSADAAPQVRADWDAGYARSADTLTARVRQLTDEATALPPYLDQWSAGLARWRPEVLEAARSGQLAHDVDRTASRPIGPNAAAAPIWELSPFHRALQEQTGAWDRLRSSPWFLTYRLLVNQAYLQLTRMGVPPQQRFQACHLVANAVADATGTSTNRPDLADLVRPATGSPA